MFLLRLLSLLVLSLLLAAPASAQGAALSQPSTSVPSPSTQALFDAELRRIVGEAGVPGAAYAIVADGRVQTARGIGVRELGGSEPVGPDTVFRIASVSKTFAAQLAALLIREGRLDWAAPVTRFAPEFRLKGGAEQRLQLRHLLGQSTGLVPNAYDNLVDAGQSLQQILPQFRTLAPSCAPGQCYGYQNIVFGLAADAIERASGQSYADLLGERVFTPLGMRHASVGRGALLAAADRASPHVQRAGAWQRIEVEPNYYQMPAAAGVNASANDLAIWLLAQMGHFPDTVRTDEVAELTTARVSTPKDLRRGEWKDLLSSAHYGLGWRIYRIGDEPIVLHAGWVKGYVAEISYSPRLRTGLVVLMNGDSGTALNEVGSRFWRLQLGVPDAPAETAPALPKESKPVAPKPPARTNAPKRSGTVRAADPALRAAASR